MSFLRVPSFLPSILQPAIRGLATGAKQLQVPCSPSFLNVAETRISVLKNGMRVATENNNGQTATVGVWIDVGSRYENQETNGVAHFLEHLAFKGTRKRPQIKLELEIEDLGAHLNAYTSREQTVYFAKVVKKDIPQAVEILSDILQNSTFSYQSVESERGVILTEMEKVGEQTQELVFDQLHCSVFEGGNLGTTILGPIENIKKFKSEDLKAFIREHYTGPRMVLAAAGGVNHDELVKIAEQAFQNIPSHNSKKSFQPSKFIPADVRIPDESKEETHIVLALEGTSWTSPDYLGMMTFQFLLGTWDRAGGGGKNLTSKLSDIVSQTELCTSYSTYNTCYSDTGLFGFYLTSHATNNLKELMEFFEYEWIKACCNPDEAEVERAKSQLKAAFLLSLDGTTPICEDIGRQLLTFGRRIKPFELNARIEAITPDTLRKLARKYLLKKIPALVAYGQIDSLPKQQELKNLFVNITNQNLK